MGKELESVLPEILWIQDEKLRGAVKNAYADALTSGGWSIEDMGKIPFTLLIPNCPVSYLAQVRAVTRMCHYPEKSVPNLEREAGHVL